MKKTLTRLTAITVATLFLIFMLGNTAFTHIHTLDNGNVIAHSHPYLPGNHTHSQAQLSGINLLNISAGQVAAAVPVAAPAPATVSVAPAADRVPAATVTILRRTIPRRGPPSGIITL